MSELDWTGGGPRSTRFDDVYFQLEDGLSESRAVYLAGTGLPERFQGRSRVCVGELGFGAGLNMLALLDLWRRARPSPDARLHMVSVEAYPMRPDEAARALSAFPELAELSAALLDGWPEGRAGLHRFDFPALGASLDLHLGSALNVLQGLEARMDAWFLDGFAPAKNPDMWSSELLSHVARCTAPGGVAATFTVAGEVRRNLAAAGFTVEKKPGFGRKRERLEATLPGTSRPRPELSVAVVGAGIAGVSLVRALRRAGLAPVLFDAADLGAGASGNPAALITPRLDAGLGPIAQLHGAAYARAIQIYRQEAPHALIARGVLQLATAPRDEGRYDKLAQWDGVAPGGFVHLSAQEAQARLGEACLVRALRLRDALVLEPAAVLEAFAAGADIRRAGVEQLAPEAGGWRLRGRNGVDLGRFDAVALAAGPATAALNPAVRLRPVRGQITLSPVRLTGESAAFGGYVISTRKGLLFGATHQRDDADPNPRGEDDAKNLSDLAAVRPVLAQTIAAGRTQHRAALRAASPDHMPLAGGLAPGLFVLSGLGGRGFTLAPLLAEQVVAQMVGAPQPLLSPLAALTAPRRFADKGLS